jgi:hypothetical protein
MLDLLYLAIIVAFFLLTLAYIAACDKLRKGEKSE